MAAVFLCGHGGGSGPAELRYGPQQFGGGQLQEHCRALNKGDVVTVDFKAEPGVDFNIHFHVGKKTHFPVQMRDVGELKHRFVADTDREYCWMWETRAGRGTTLEYVSRLVR